MDSFPYATARGRAEATKDRRKRADDLQRLREESTRLREERDELTAKWCKDGETLGERLQRERDDTTQVMGELAKTLRERDKARAEGRAEGLREIQAKLGVMMLNTDDSSKRAYANVGVWVRELTAAPAGVAKEKTDGE